MTSYIKNLKSDSNICDKCDTESERDFINNTIKLQLKKPRRWKWELTTSKSSPNILFPRILLYNYKGDLLAETKEADNANEKNNREQVYPTIIRSSSNSKIGLKSSSSSQTSSKNKTNFKKYLEDQDDSFDQTDLDKLKNSLKDQRKRRNKNFKLDDIEKPRLNLADIKENSPEDSDESDSLSFNNLTQKPEVSSYINNEQRPLKSWTTSKDLSNLSNKNYTLPFSKEVQFDLHKSKSVSNIPERTKRRTRSNNSVPAIFSESILERLSAFKRRCSSTDSEEWGQLTLPDTPKYSLRTSNAGTLVVCEENFKNRKVRRRQRSNPKNTEKKEAVTNQKQKEITPKCAKESDDKNGSSYSKILNSKSDISLAKRLSGESNYSDEILVKSKENSKLNVTAKKSSTPRENVENIGKVQQKRKLKHIRRCRSLGIVYSSSEEEIPTQNRKPLRNRYKKSENTEKGDLCSNTKDSNYCSIPSCNHNDLKYQKTFIESFGVKYCTLDRRDNIATDSMCSDASNIIVVPSSGIRKEDKIKYGGSLPNNLENDDENEEKNYNLCKENNVQSSTRINNSNQGKTVLTNPKFISTKSKEDDQICNAFKILLTRTNIDPSYDQGYGSERSPEEEMVPHLFTDSNYRCQETDEMYKVDTKIENIKSPVCRFITEECTFSVQIIKGPRGLGLSIYGGTDSNAAFPGLIRIKRLFPHQPAWSTGKLQPGDIILEANDVPLTGLTNYEALEVLRTAPTEVFLLICRPNDESYRKLSPPSEPPKPPQRVTPQSTQIISEKYHVDSTASAQTKLNGEFEITMIKHQGSLGFTLRKEDECTDGHYVRTLVREPATTDGRIQPGDKIIAVNDIPLSLMTHEQAVIFLRQAPDVVKLRLYRDEDQIPAATASFTTFNKESIGGTLRKTHLRPEAINLLSDLAHKKQITSGNSTESSTLSNASPRRLKRGTKNSKNISHTFQSATDSDDFHNNSCCTLNQVELVCNNSIPSPCSHSTQELKICDNLNTSDINQPSHPKSLDIIEPISETLDASKKSKSQCFDYNCGTE